MAETSTRGRILDAALHEFDEKGYEATTVAGICRRAGVSNGSFFHAFPSKEAVAAAVFLAALGAYHAALAAAVAGDTAPAEGVAALVSAHVRWVMDNRRQARFMFLHTPHADGGQADQAAQNVRFRADLALWYAPHLASGMIQPMPPEVLVSQIIGPVQMFCRAWLSGRSREAPDIYLPALIACAVRAVVSPGSRAARDRMDLPSGETSAP